MSNVSYVPVLIGATVLVSRLVSNRGGSAGRSVARGKGPAPVSVSHDFGDPEVTALRRAVTSGSWDGVAAVLQPCRDRGDYARMTWLINCVDELPGGFLIHIAKERPDDALARTLAGAKHITWAWDARTGARASQVSREQFRLFHERLQLAEEHLYAAIELDPETAAPWYFLTISSRGLQHGADVTRRRFEAGDRRAPEHLGLHMAMLQQVCAKWSGSHEEMHAFARASLAKASPGSSLGVLTARAHLEHWLDLDKDERTAYIREFRVGEELRQAAAASVLHPAYRPTASPFPALNEFAMAFWLAGDLISARQMFDLIGDHATQSPWGFYGNPGRAFANARAECRKAKPAKPVKPAKKSKFVKKSQQAKTPATAK